MSERKWKVGEFSETGGYDCMTAGISAGPADLDGAGYGQKRCQPLADDAKARMIADARLIAAAPDMAIDGLFLMERLAELDFSDVSESFMRDWYGHVEPALSRFRAALAKATGGPS